MSATNLVWADGYVKPEDFEKRNNQRGCVIWFTGLSASGKSTIAREMEWILFERGFQVFVLDGDNIRHGLNKDLGFSPEDREENIRRIGEVAKLFSQAGIIAITAFISPYREDREKARAIVGAGRFFEVHVHADVETCRKRDPKGLYEKALNGKIPEFTGVSAPYEPPTKPEVFLDTESLSVHDSAVKVIEVLETSKVISRQAKSHA